MPPESNAEALEKLIKQETRHVAECCKCDECITTDELDADSFADCLAKDGWIEGEDEDGEPGLLCPMCADEDEEDDAEDEDEEDEEDE